MSHDGKTDDGYRLNRRSALSALGVGAGTVVGLGAFSGTATAWERFDVCFQDCSEVWMIVDDEDIGNGHFAEVIVESDGEAVCRRVEFTEANATKTEEFGDSQVVKYDLGEEDDKILGVQEWNDGMEKATYCVWVNDNECANAANTPDVHSAPCVPDEQPTCPESDYCAGEDTECPPCESGKELLVKYEWSGGKFVSEGSDGNIEPTSWTLDEDGEPVEACFTTDYCEVDAVVKAGQGYETYEDESGAFCVTGITKENPQGKEITHAISNVQFFCETPDDPSVGNSSGNNRGGGGGKNT